MSAKKQTKEDKVEEEEKETPRSEKYLPFRLRLPPRFKGPAKFRRFRGQGEFPRETKNWLRYRQEDPKKFSIFRVKRVSPTTQLVFGRLKKTGKWIIQSVMKKKK